MILNENIISADDINMDILKNILPSRLFEVIEKAGINTPNQIMILSAWDIQKVTNLKNEDIHILKNIVTQHLCPVSLTGDTFGKQHMHLKTGCTDIDNILDGGFRKGTVTEIYGESGTGKTQLLMQVAAHCGSNGSVFICTEDLFPVKRFNQITKSMCGTDCNNNMFIEHITEAHELIACVRVQLPRLLNTNKVAVVVVDSVAAPFRCEYNNYVQRAEDLKELGMLLYKLAKQHNISIICVNQVSSSFDDSDHVLPTLGLVWSNIISYKVQTNMLPATRYIKDKDITMREIKIVNAPDLPISSTKFIITANGIENFSI